MNAPTDWSEPRPVAPSARAPWTDSRFWLLQTVVLALALVRLAATVGLNLDTSNLALEVSTVVIFIIPVVIAALYYGWWGGIATVAWTTVLCVPRLAEAADHGRTAALWAEVLQLAVLAVAALLIGRRVSAETRVRDQADTARRARVQAELLYRDLFESNQSPILIVDAQGFVIESNASADHAFRLRARDADPGDGGGTDSGRSRRLVDVIGADAASLVLTHLVSDDAGTGDVGQRNVDPSGADDRVPPVPFDVSGQRVLYRPTATLVGSTATDRRMQVIFEDVTAETRRHDLMEAYAGRVVLGQEEERRHIAQELHDGPLQTLIHLCRQIDSLGANSGTPARSVDDVTVGVPPSLASLRTTVEVTVAELRSIARGLRPSVLDDLGLVASLNQILSDASARQGFETSLSLGGDVARLPPAIELAVFRIAQEAITNVERHAEAGRVVVSLDFGDSGLRLRVQDDGVGFARSDRLDDGQSLGLPGMSERARLIGGRVQIRSEVGQGTSVEVWVPTSVLGSP